MPNENDYRGTQNKQEGTSYEQVVKSNQFKQLMKRKKNFIVPFTIFFLCFYFLLPILTGYTTFLNEPVIGDITWAWLFAWAQFVMTWALCIIYVKRANRFDKQSDQIINDQLEDRGGN